jgi:hypothetical protein
MSQMSVVDGVEGRQPGLLAGYMVVSALLAGVAFWLSSMAQPFVQVFRSFGGEIPWITSLVMSSVSYWAVFPLVSFVAGLALALRRTRSPAALRAARIGLSCFTVLLIALPVFTLVAFYEPIRRLGDASHADCVANHRPACVARAAEALRA